MGAFPLDCCPFLVQSPPGSGTVMTYCLALELRDGLVFASYPRDALRFSHQLSLDADSDLFRNFSRCWNEQMLSAFRSLPRFERQRRAPQES